MRFDETVPDGGYLWWYVDAVSDDGLNALTIIVFVGSVFSPYYHWSGGPAENHCAINVCLYGPRANRWTMTERGAKALSRDKASYALGPSSMRWDGASLIIDVDEVSTPLPRRVRGRVKLHPTALNARDFMLDAAGRHRWMPLAPTARVEVDFAEPSIAWAGHGYLDTNMGLEPTARAFDTWDWSRAEMPEGTAVLYDIVEKGGARREIATLFKADGSTEDFEPPPRVALPRTFWALPRGTQADAGTIVTVERTLEDTPFYARSMLRTRLLGREAPAVHESLSVRRLDTPIVRAMLPFRMPRRG